MSRFFFFKYSAVRQVSPLFPPFGQKANKAYERITSVHITAEHDEHEGWWFTWTHCCHCVNPELKVGPSDHQVKFG